MNLPPADPSQRRTLGAVLLPALLAPTAVFLATAIGNRIFLPLLATAAIYPIMAYLILRDRRFAALAATLLWAASFSATIMALTARDPGGTGHLILRGPAYRDEMFAFIRAGTGKESDPVRFLPEHALHLGAFLLLTGISGGLLGITLGAVLIAYMSYYVGALVATGGSPALAVLLGWPPWAILRVVAFTLLGVALSRPVLYAARRRFPETPPGPTRGSSGAVRTWDEGVWRSWYLAAFGLLLADAALKALFAPSWAVLLRPCLGAP